MFQETNDSTLQKLYDVKIKPYENQEMFTNASMGIERIRTEFHGFMVKKLYTKPQEKLCT